MLNIGSHLSVTKGYEQMGKTAMEMNANTFQFFTRNPRGGKAKALDLNDLNNLKEFMANNDFAPILAHAAYTMNLASNSSDTRQFGIDSMIDDLARLEHIPCELYNFHPGSHTGAGVEEGIDRIINGLNQAITGNESTYILLETMSGKGTEIGSRFEEIKMIIDGVKNNQKMGVTLDTCHVFSAGYDIINQLEDVINEFDQIIGLNRLKAIHLNDSLKPFDSHKDRHAGIGEGEIGLDAIVQIITHPKLKDLPFYLETPYDEAGHSREIELLKSYVK